MADRIPTELVERILIFAASIDTPIAAAVCLTNKLGWGAATPLLYHTLDILGWRDDGLLDKRMHKLSLLSRTLVNSRQLATHVYTIKVYLDYPEDVLLGDFHNAALPPDHDAFLRLVQVGLPLGTTQKRNLLAWLDLQIQNGIEVVLTREGEHDDQDGSIDLDVPDPFFGPEFYLSMITLACSHLQVLEISGNTECMDTINMVNMALHRGAEADEVTTRRPDGLGNVKEVYLSTPTKDYLEKWETQAIIEALPWPSLERMTIDCLTGEMGFHISHGNPSHYSNLTRLHITDTMVETAELEPLLKHCPQLKSFRIYWHEETDVYRTIDWVELAALLEEFNPLLEELYLDIAHEENLREVYHGIASDDEAQVNSQGLRNLDDFKHLRKLSAPYIALFGVFDHPHHRNQHWTWAQIIPQSLEELEIFCEGIHFREDDRAYLNAPGTSRLSDITIWNCTREKWISRSHGEGQSA